METPVEIYFRGMKPVERVRLAIATHIADLEQRYGPITACRAVLKTPGDHHCIGLYEINVRLALPNGREVNVSRIAQQGERYTDVDLAIHDMFNLARRRLQDHVRRIQGQVKTHEAQPIGTGGQARSSRQVWTSRKRRQPRDLFSQDSVLDGAFSQLAIGPRVAFAEKLVDKGPQASTVRLLGKQGMR
jgi:hypothetical protein